MTIPFLYPAEPHVRRHGPQGYADYASYLPWLRDEFSFRCVYCLLRESWGRVRGVYAIDHFLATARRPTKIADYDNLLYACATCNTAKGARSVPDPLAVLTSPEVRIAEDGTIHADSVEAARLIELLGLDSPQSTEFRMLWIGIVALAAAIPGLKGWSARPWRCESAANCPASIDWASWNARNLALEASARRAPHHHGIDLVHSPGATRFPTAFFRRPSRRWIRMGPWGTEADASSGVLQARSKRSVHVLSTRVSVRDGPAFRPLSWRVLRGGRRDAGSHRRPRRPAAARCPAAAGDGALASLRRFLAFLPDDKTLLTGEYTGGNVRCWDTATGKEGASFHVPGGMRPVALSPDGKTLAVDATQELQHAVLLVGVPDGKEIRRIETATTVPGANLCFLRLDFSPDGKTLAAVGNDRVVRLFDVETGKTIFCRAGVDGNRFSTAFSPDGKRLAFTDAEDTLRILEIAAEKEVFKQRLGGGNCLLQNMSFSADGKKVAWRGEDEKTFALWDIASGEPVLQFHGPSEMVEVVHFSPDGTHIAARYSGENGETVRVWDAATGKELRKLVAPSRFAGPLAFSPDGKRLAACDDNDGVVHLWDVETGKELSRVGEHQGFVRSVAFSPDGRTALTGVRGSVHPLVGRGQRGRDAPD